MLTQQLSAQQRPWWDGGSRPDVGTGVGGFTALRSHMMLGSWVCPMIKGVILVFWCFRHLVLLAGIPRPPSERPLNPIVNQQ